LVDAVCWSPAYPASHPIRDVYRWYARWFSNSDNTNLLYVNAEDDVLAAVQHQIYGVIVSGSPRDAWVDDPVNEKLCSLVGFCQREGIPFLGVCYGHQILARALGGRVARHPEGLELGNTPVELTPEGQRSALFSGFPKNFDVLSSHADAVLELPSETELLVRGEFTPVQGFHWQNRLFGVQFHPETDPDTLRFLWSTRRDLWRPKVMFDLDQVLDNLQSTPMAGNVLRNFVNRIVP
jgi:GMP synthase (glutamine-hydrolysing)